MNDIIVYKIGGSILPDITAFPKIAKFIINEKKKQKNIVIVISAMRGITDSLIADCMLVKEMKTLNDLREYNNIITKGEEISSSLLSLALLKESSPSISLNSNQLRIKGKKINNIFSHGKILSINAEIIKNYLKQGITPIIAGFQSIVDKEVIHLGRGGSDTTAVFLSHVLNAKKCKILGDVDGIYTADPSKIKNTSIIKQLSYEDAIKLSSYGAKVINHNAALLAKKYNINLEILTPYFSKNGTRINDKGNKINAIAYIDNCIKFNINCKNNKKIIKNFFTKNNLFHVIEKSTIFTKKSIFNSIQNSLPNFLELTELKKEIALITLLNTNIIIFKEKIFSILEKKGIIVLWSSKNRDNFKMVVESCNMICTIQDIHNFLINNSKKL